MNAVVPFREEVALPVRYGLVPSSMLEAMKLAEMMASAKLVPSALQKSPADCLMVIQQAVRWDMDPFAVAQECSVIQGKLMHSGKLVAAVVNARGSLTQRLSFEYRGEGDNRAIVVSGQLQGEPQARTVEVLLRNAKTQNAMWTKQPDQQLMYHGVRVWARRHTPELMLGVWSPEEFDEAQSQPRRAPMAAPNVMLPPHNPDTGEVTDDITGAVSGTAAPSQNSPAGGAAVPSPETPDAYCERWRVMKDAASNGAQLGKAWKDDKPARDAVDWSEHKDQLRELVAEVGAAIKFLSAQPVTP